MADARIALIERQGATGEEATVRIRIGYSVVIPAYNEMDNVEPLYEEIVAVMDGVDDTYEILFVNDGSTDYTNSVLNRLAASDHAVRAPPRRRWLAAARSSRRWRGSGARCGSAPPERSARPCASRRCAR